MSVDIGHSLPNLKITVGNDGKSQIEEEENIEMLDSSTESAENVQVVRKIISPIETFRKYENKGGAFITGLDLSSEVVTKKLVDRAARFGLEAGPQKPITQTEIDALYKSLDIEPKEGKCKNIRLDALHVRGVEEMSTSDVIDYFKEYGPSSVEWINDFSCNVVWLDESGAARALLGLSRVLVLKKKNAPQDDSQKEQDAAKENETEDKAEEVIFMSDLSSDDEEDESDKLVSFKHQRSSNPSNLDAETPMEIATEDGELPKSGDEKEDKDISEDIQDEKGDKDISMDIRDEKEDKDISVDIPVPPGHWRLGLPVPKAKAILLRFATKDDKKLPGAERRSQYYQKYGNPNYGGLRGLISNTRKRRFNITKQRHVVEQLSTKGNLNNLNLPNAEPTRKRLRMRMHADDEEERLRLKNAKKQRTVERLTEHRNVHERLGGFVPRRRTSYDDRWSDKDYDNRRSDKDYDNRWSDKDYDNRWSDKDYDNRGSDKDYDEEEEDDRPLNIKSTISQPLNNKQKRNNIWTRLAESMAQESRVFESGSKLPSRSTERRGRDLRSKIHSSSSRPRRRRDSGEKSHTDLRTKLNKLRKSEKHTQHRSPLLVDSDNSSDSER